MLNKNLFILAHQVGEKRFYKTYQDLLMSQWASFSDQKHCQEKQLRKMVDFAYKNVPYYHKLFDKLNIAPSNIRTVEDLQNLPILTKDIIKRNWEDFKPINLNEMKYRIDSTDGSTGSPFKFRLLRYDRFFSGAILYRGWGYAGYELGDKMVFLAGSALAVGANTTVVKRAHEISRNIRKLSSFDMSVENMQSYAKTINSFKPKFIRGYASSINLFVDFIDKNDVEIAPPQAVFTTAEKLIPYMRKNIEDVLGCNVYDTYGLNDGGVTAYECPEHTGLHIDTERSIMEVVDNDGIQIEDGVGKILATSLHNYAMPFIRYDTGDMAHIIHDTCSCGRKSKILKEIMGRSLDILLTPDGKHVHGNFILFIFDNYGIGVKEYQVVQENINTLIIKIVPEENFNEKNLDLIKKTIKQKSNEWEVKFKFVDKIDRTKGGKYKFIINKVIRSSNT